MEPSVVIKSLSRLPIVYTVACEELAPRMVAMKATAKPRKEVHIAYPREEPHRPQSQRKFAVFLVSR